MRQGIPHYKLALAAAGNALSLVTSHPERPSWRELGFWAAIYCALAIGTLELADVLRAGVPFWPAAGVAVGAVLLLGWRAWPVPFIGAVINTLWMGVPLPLAMLGGVGATLSALLLLLTPIRHTQLTQSRDLWYVLLATLIATALCCNFGLLAYHLQGQLPWSEYRAAWLDWVLGDSLGVLLVTPLIFAWKRKPPVAYSQPSPRKRLRLYVTITLLAILGFFHPFAWTDALNETSVLLAAPALAWTVRDFAEKDVTNCLAIVTLCALGSSTLDHGAFIDHGQVNTHQLAFFLWMTNLSVLLMSTSVAANRSLIAAREASEARLQEAYEQVKNLHNIVNDAIFFKDGAGRWIFANQVGLELFQLTDKDWHNKTDAELADVAASPTIAAAHRACIESDNFAYALGEMYQCEEVIPGKFGKLSYWDVRKFPRFTPDGARNGIVVHARDTTLGREALDLLMENENRFKQMASKLRTVMDALPAQVALIGPQQTFEVLNQYWISSCKTRCGLLANEEVCHISPDYCPQIHGDKPSPKVVEGIAAIRNQETLLYTQEFATTDTGPRRWYGLMVTPIDPVAPAEGQVVMIRDITSTKSAEEIVRRSERRLRAITEYSPDFILRVGAQGRLLYTNQTLTRFRNEVLKSGIVEYAHYLWGDKTTSELWQTTIEDVFLDGMQREILFDLTIHSEQYFFQARLVAETSTDNPSRVTSILAVVRDISSIRQAEQVVRESRDRLRSMAIENARALEDEKRALARELHDDTGQILGALRMGVGMLKMEYGDHVPEISERASKLTGLLERATVSLRRVVSNLRPPVVDMGLEPSLEWICDDVPRIFPGLSCQFEKKGNIPEPDKDTTIMIFRVVQEALTNIVKHSRATQAAVSIECSDEGQFILLIKDNGIGFDIQQRSADYLCFGLLGMRERALAVNGELQVFSTIGHGTRIKLTIPGFGKEQVHD